ncbi:MAG: hypothetical protein AAGA96_16230 [Verrucomicrobiota bacterium]
MSWRVAFTCWLGTWAWDGAGAQDVIFLKSGQSAAADVEAITDKIIVFRLLQGGRGESQSMPIEQVAYVEFEFEPGEEEAFARRDSLPLEEARKWWDFHFAHLHRPRSRTAAWGIACAQALLREQRESDSNEALRLFERIAERAWDEADIAAARQGRLQALIALGDLETATREARILSAETEDPALLIEVKHLLAQADFAKLEALEEEHPRWEEDDEVRPERNQLYHNTIDQFLWPYLFHAARDDAATRGLLAASEVYAFGGDFERAAAACLDLTRLYPKHELSEEAKQRLEQLQHELPNPTSP